MDSVKEKNVFLNILKGVSIAIIFTLVCLTIYSTLLTYTNLSENSIQPVVISVTGISILAGSFLQQET